MKYILLFLLMLSLHSNMLSQLLVQGEAEDDVKEISISWDSEPNATIYFGIHSDNTYLIDSLTLGPRGEGIFKVSKDLNEGTYFIGFPNKTGFFDFIYDRNDIHIVIDDNNVPTFPDSKLNRDVVQYFKLNRNIGILSDSLQNDSSLSGNQRESILKKLQKSEEERNDFISNYLSQESNNYLKFMLTLSQPADLSDIVVETKQDTLQYIYERQKRYWNNVDFSDDRVINNPLVINLINNYFDDILPKNVDTLKAKAIELIEKADSGSEVQRFLIASLMNKYISPEFIGLDAIFLEIYLEYILNKDNEWLGEENLKTAELKVNQIYFNQIGNPGRDFTLLDIDGKLFNAFDYLSDDGLVMVFWDPSCSHCKIEMPTFDSLLKTEIKKHFPKLKILGVMVDGGVDNWKEFIKANGLDNNLWVHGYDTKEMRDEEYLQQKPNFRQLYGIDQTPIFYYLNKDKIIQIKGPISPEQLIHFLKSKIKQ